MSCSHPPRGYDLDALAWLLADLTGWSKQALLACLPYGRLLRGCAPTRQLATWRVAAWLQMPSTERLLSADMAAAAMTATAHEFVGEVGDEPDTVTCTSQASDDHPHPLYARAKVHVDEPFCTIEQLEIGDDLVPGLAHQPVDSGCLVCLPHRLVGHLQPAISLWMADKELCPHCGVQSAVTSNDVDYDCIACDRAWVHDGR